MTAATLAPPMEPGSAKWFQYMTASKIAAVVGLSTWESPFSLWHRMAGLIEPDPDNDQKRRGHYLEPAIRAWFGDQHPTWSIEHGNSWISTVYPWQAATPDAMVYNADGWLECLGEFKTAHEDDDWGDPGSDDIPVGYRCQVMWQMDVLGVNRCHVVVLNRHLEFAEYVVDYDSAEAELLRDAGREFMDSLASGDPPTLDGHSETYRALQHLHPEIDGTDADIDEDLARLYCDTRAALAVAELDEQVAKNRMAAAMGNARRARYKHQTVATRQARGSGHPYLVAGRRLPTFPPKAA